MPPAADAVQIRDLADFQRDLAAVDRKLRATLNKELRTAGEPIRDDARRRYAESRFTPRSGKSQRAIRSETHYGGVAVSLGGSRRPWLVGQEWGSHQYQWFGPPRGRWHQPDPDKAGTFFWPAYRAGVRNIESEIAAAMDRALVTLAGSVNRRGQVINVGTM